MENEQKKTKLIWIQVLRGLSALMVVLYHSNALSKNFNTQKSYFELIFKNSGQIGVDIFFIISGFLITVTTFNLKDRYVFLKRRLVRIVPLYWICTTFFLGIYLLKPMLFKTFKFNLWHVISSFLFIPAMGPDSKIAPVVSYGWSLNFEILFYVLFFLGFTFKIYQKIFLLFVSFLLLILLNSVINEPLVIKSIVSFFSDSIFLTFIVGVCLGDLFKKKNFFLFETKKYFYAIVFGLFLFFLLKQTHFYEYRIVSRGLPAFLIFITSLKIDLNSNPKQYEFNLKGMILLGDISYSTYLIQTFSLPLFIKFSNSLKLYNFLNINLLVSAAVIFTLLSSYLVYSWLEIPISNFFLKRIKI